MTRQRLIDALSRSCFFMSSANKVPQTSETTPGYEAPFAWALIVKIMLKGQPEECRCNGNFKSKDVKRVAQLRYKVIRLCKAYSQSTLSSPCWQQHRYSKFYKIFFLRKFKGNITCLPFSMARNLSSPLWAALRELMSLQGWCHGQVAIHVWAVPYFFVQYFNVISLQTAHKWGKWRLPIFSPPLFKTSGFTYTIRCWNLKTIIHQVWTSLHLAHWLYSDTDW